MSGRAFPALATIGLILCVGGVGCGSSAPMSGAVSENAHNLRMIKTAYLNATKRLGRPPQNLEDLMPFLKKAGDPAKILRSPDDGEEYKIVWGVDLHNADDDKLPVIAYEKRGKDGKRYLLQGNQIRHLTDEELKKAPFPPGKAPS